MAFRYRAWWCQATLAKDILAAALPDGVLESWHCGKGGFPQAIARALVSALCGIKCGNDQEVSL